MKKRQQIRNFLILGSLFLLPLTIFYFSPVIPFAAAKGIFAGSLITFVVLFFFSLFVGRAFCGWLCPAGGLNKVCTLMSDKPSPRFKIIRWLIWMPWISGIAAMFILAGGIQSIEPLYQTVGGISISEPWQYVIYYGFGLLIVLPSVFIGRHFFCHHLCWMAPFMIIGKNIGKLLKLPQLQLTADKKRCTSCKKCERVCPMSLPVINMVVSETISSNECILCGECADSCPQNVIRITM